MRSITKKFLDAVIATTTSDPFNIEGVQKMSIQILAAAITSGNGVFKVEVSNDNVNWITFNKLIDNLVNTNAQTLVRVASATLSANGNKVYTLDLEHDAYKYMRVTVTRTTDGTYSATAQAQLVD